MHADAEWDRLRRVVASTTIEAFCETHPAYLYARRLPENASSQFRTKLASCLPGGDSNIRGARRLVRIEKRPGGLYRERIGVGRTRTSDIVVVSAKVSKFHGYFQRTEDGYRFTDFDSTNGTFLNDRPLAARAPADLSDRDRLRFGDVEFEFLLPSTVFHLVRAEIGTQSGT